jgi:hypothetical protein
MQVQQTFRIGAGLGVLSAADFTGWVEQAFRPAFERTDDPGFSLGGTSAAKGVVVLIG